LDCFWAFLGRAEKQKAGFCPLLCLLMDQYRSDEIAEHTDSLAYYRIGLAVTVSVTFAACT